GRTRAAEPGAGKCRQEAGTLGRRAGSDASPTSALTAQRFRAPGLPRRDRRPDREHRPEPPDAPPARASPQGQAPLDAVPPDIRLDMAAAALTHMQRCEHLRNDVVAVSRKL